MSGLLLAGKVAIDKKRVLQAAADTRLVKVYVPVGRLCGRERCSVNCKEGEHSLCVPLRLWSTYAHGARLHSEAARRPTHFLHREHSCTGSTLAQGALLHRQHSCTGSASPQEALLHREHRYTVKQRGGTRTRPTRHTPCRNTRLRSPRQHKPGSASGRTGAAFSFRRRPSPPDAPQSHAPPCRPH